MQAPESKDAEAGTGERVLAGRVLNAKLNFVFEVWAYRKLPIELLQRAYWDFLARQSNPSEQQSLRGVTVKQDTNWGLPSAS